MLTGYFGLSFLYYTRRRMERIDNEASINDNSNQSRNQINPRQWQTVFPVISIATWRQFHSKLGDTEETKDQRVHPAHSHNECFRFSMNRQLINHAYAESFEFTWITYFTHPRRWWNPKSWIDRSELIWNFRETITQAHLSKELSLEDEQFKITEEIKQDWYKISERLINIFVEDFIKFMGKQFEIAER